MRHEVREVVWHRWPGEPHVVLVHKTHGPAHWQTTVHECLRLRVPRAQYDAAVRRAKQQHARLTDAEAAVYEQLRGGGYATL